jgi:transposase
MRKLPAAAQEERRRQVVGLRQRGLTYGAIAEQVGLSRTGVFDICQRFAAEGAKGLASKPRGRKPDEQRLLDAAQEAEVQGLIRRHTPDELGLPFALWSRAAVGMLIARRCGVELAVRTAASTWRAGASPPRSRSGAPTSRTRRRCGAGCGGTTRPSSARAKRARGAVFWGDETGLRSDDVRGRSYAPRGRTPLVRVCHKRAGLSLISAVANRGELRWMVVDGAVNAPTLIRFLRRLIRDARRKVFLILDRLRVHRARLTRDWLAEHRSAIEVHYLPPYSPEPSGQCPEAGRGRERRPEAGGPPQGAGAQQTAAQASGDQPHAPARQEPKRIRSIFQHQQFRYAA